MKFQSFSLHLLTLLASVLLLSITFSCQWSNRKYSPQRSHDEEVAMQMLDEARQQFHRGNYEDARKLIVVMRDSCRYALSAREQGILLLDSIELFQVKSDTSSADWRIKEKFYQKKLEHDIMQTRKHE